MSEAQRAASQWREQVSRVRHALHVGNRAAAVALAEAFDWPEEDLVAVVMAWLRDGDEPVGDHLDGSVALLSRNER